MSNRQLTGVIIVGGGAAGIIAALAARYQGAGVTILEKNQRIGKKLLATGNGRCNLTNVDLDIANYHGMIPEFAHGALSRFDVKRTIEFFEHLGVAHKVEDGGKVFPCSNQASSVLDVLRYELEEAGVNVVCEAEVKEIKKKGQGFTVHLANGKGYQAARVIIATGGKAAPQLGSNGSGLTLAKSLGHKIIEPFPALVQLKLAANFFKQIKGIKLDGRVEIVAGDKSIARAQGEILFTEYGISGPPVLGLSRTAGELMKKKEEIWLKVVIVNDRSGPELDQYLTYRFAAKPKKTLVFSLVGFINKKLVPVLLREAGITD
ncbi:MAG: aminoacetone oxidase family FAD-binding enzyme, partial [Desulfotomaculaceae bacterium]|nr:aminoacetone oxidase family FAD-binding enzyme [Desulfotomaculaceae bacterium]